MNPKELRRLRLDAGLTQQQLSRLALLNPSAINHYENGSRRIQPFMARYLTLIVQRYVNHQRFLAKRSHFWLTPPPPKMSWSKRSAALKAYEQRYRQRSKANAA